MPDNSDRLRLALDAARFGVWEIVLPERRLIWDETCGAMFGLEQDAYPRNSEEFLQHVLPEDRERVIQNMMETTRLGTDYSCEFRIVRSGAEVRWHSAFGRFLPGRDGEPDRIIGVCTDTTQQRVLERAVGQSQRMEVVARLAGGIAHDFNNLLLVVDGHASLMEDRLSDDPQALESLQSIRMAVERATKLTLRLLAYSGSDQAIRREEICLNRVLQESQPTLRQIVSNTSQLRCPKSDCDAVVLGDRLQLIQILVNLCTNACDAMPGGGTITVRTDLVHLTDHCSRLPAHCTAGDFAVLEVIDSGCGIPEALKERVFDPFFSTKGIGTRTGLGLAIVERIVRDMGGFVELGRDQAQQTVVRALFPAAGRLQRPTASQRTGVPEPGSRNLAVL